MALVFSETSMKPIIIAAAMLAVLLGGTALPALARSGAKPVTADCDWRMTPCARMFGANG
jgi:hypothetical protein